MKSSTKDGIKSKLHVLKGKVKEKVGKLTDDPNLEAEGQAENMAGKVQETVGRVKRILGK